MLALESVVEAFPSLFADTRLEADLPDLLWSLVNLFHRKADRISRDQGDNWAAPPYLPEKGCCAAGRVKLSACNRYDCNVDLERAGSFRPSPN